MKKAFFTKRVGQFLGLFLLIFVVICCSKTEPDNPETPVTPAEPDKLELAASVDRNPVVSVEGGTVEISFTASTSWSASIINDRADAWCSVSPAGGGAGSGKITVTVKENSEPDDRSATVVIKAGTASQIINITQKQKDAIILTATKFELPEEGGEFSVEIKSNVSFKYTISEDAKDWIAYVSTKALTTTVMTFSVEKNERLVGRNGNIIIGEGALCDTIKVYQVGETPAIVLGFKEYTADPQGGTFSVDVSSNVNVSTIIEYTNEDGTVKTDSENWLYESKTKTMSTNVYNFTIEKNFKDDDRYARIVFTNKDNNLSDTVNIVQQSISYIRLSVSNCNLGDAGGVVRVSVASGTEYDVIMPEGDWITNISNGDDSNMHQFRVDVNESDSFRCAEIIFASRAYTTRDTLKIMQAGGTKFFLTEDTLVLSYKETVFPIHGKMRSDRMSLQTIIGSEYSWISEYRDSKTKVIHDFSHYLKVAENTADTIRFGTVVFYERDSKLYDTLVIKQLQKSATVQKTFNIRQKEFVIPMVSQHITLEIEHNGSYHLDDIDRLHGKCLLLDVKPKFSKGNTDYYRVYIFETDTPREMHLYLFDELRSVCDTITVKQQETDEYIHVGHGFNASLGIIVPYNGINLSYDIHTNLSDYRLLQFPSNGAPELTHLRREKTNFGFTDYFRSPVNNTNHSIEIPLLYIGENTSYEGRIIVRPKLIITFDTPEEVMVPHSGGKFSTNVWTNDDNLNVRIEGDDTSWLRTIDTEKESRDEFARVITTFEASPNATGKQRVAYVVAYNGFGDTESIRVVQPSGDNILLSESLYYVGSWEQVLKAELIDCDYKVELVSGNGWVKVGQSEKNDNRIFHNIEVAENTTDTERQAKVRFTSDTIVNEMTLIQLPQSDALVDNSSEVWKSFKLPRINFKAPYPSSLGTMIYNAIVKDPEVLIAVESRKVLEQLYFSPDEPLIPRRDEIEYKLDNYDGVSAFYSGGNSSGIILSNQYVESYYKQYGVKKLVEENRGVLSHELTHSFQLSPKGVGDYSNPIFHACIEGMADAVRVLTGHFTESDRPKGGTYLDSYRYTGFFIAWLVKNKDKDFLRKFNMSTQYLDVWSFDGAIKYALGEQYNVDALWNEYQKAMGDINDVDDSDVTTFQQMLDKARSFTNSSSTPMGKHYDGKHTTTDEDRKWLLDPENEPSMLNSASRYTWRNYEVDLYPFGSPVPADANQRGIGDCSAIAVFAEMAYLFPDFIKSIITDNNDGTYTVAMYDPQGKPVNVRIKSTFLGDDNGLGACAGKNGKATWATVMEKAIMKWNYIYQVNPDIAGIGSEHVAPLFTGQGNSFAFRPNDLTPKQLDQVVDIALENNMIVIGGFNKGGLNVNGISTVTAHAYSFMYSSESDAMFAMRNPWGHNDGEKKGQDGLLHIVNDGIVPKTIDLRIIYPGAAEQYVVKDLQPYIPPQYTTKMIYSQTLGKLILVQQ